MDNLNSFQPNWYYQPTQTQAYYNPYQSRTWNTQYATVPQYQSQNQQQVNNTNIIWVQGESGAKAQNVPNGCHMAFFDSENQCIYIKSVDNVGKPSLTILDYTDRNAPVENNDEKIEYVTQEQLDDITEKFKVINEKLDGIGSYVTKDQFNSLSEQLEDLCGQVGDIRNRISNFSKSQQNYTANKRGNK